MSKFKMRVRRWHEQGISDGEADLPKKAVLPDFKGAYESGYRKGSEARLKSIRLRADEERLDQHLRNIVDWFSSVESTMPALQIEARMVKVFDPSSTSNPTGD